MRLNFNKWVFDLDPRKRNVISDAQTASIAIHERINEWWLRALNCFICSVVARF